MRPSQQVCALERNELLVFVYNDIGDKYTSPISVPMGKSTSDEWGKSMRENWNASVGNKLGLA